MKHGSPATVRSHVGTAAPGCPVERSSTAVACGKTKPAPTLEARAAETIKLIMARLKSFHRVFNAALREIFDESAYARFLSQRQLASSRAAYAAFRQEHEIAKARRPKCC
jgi:hypothetical protein